MGFVYEDITLQERAGIGMLAALHRGSYGLVTDLARELGTSRKFIYGLARKAMEAVTMAMAPAPVGARPLSVGLELDKRQLDRAIVTLAMVGRVSERAIGECLGEIYRVRPSLGYVSGVLSGAGLAAEQFNREQLLDLGEVQVEADELFVCSRAHLAAVDHNSLLILILKQAERLDTKAWRTSLRAVLAGGAKIRRLASDGGTALGSAVSELAGVEHQLDRWHALRKVGRVLRSLEQKAYGAIGKEEELARKAAPMDRSHPMGGYVHDRHREVRRQTGRAIDLYEAMRILKGWVAEALEAIEERSGRLRSRGEWLGELRAATALMRELGTDGVSRLAGYLDKAGPALLAYADQLALPMARLARDSGAEGVRLLCREWLLEKRLRHSARTEDKTAYLRARLLCLLHHRQGYGEARGTLFGLLDSTMRGSSLVECLNSLLRPYAQLMRGLSARFLPLFQFYRNARIFPRGKRAGRSPLQLAGIGSPEGDWLDWLGLGTSQPTATSAIRLPASVRSLPTAV